jgi:hypothetical protein
MMAVRNPGHEPVLPAEARTFAALSEREQALHRGIEQALSDRLIPVSGVRVRSPEERAERHPKDSLSLVQVALDERTNPHLRGIGHASPSCIA